MAEERTVRQLAAQLRTLTLFRPLLEDPVLGRYVSLLEGLEGTPDERAGRYCDFVAALYEAGGDLGKALLKTVLEGENAVVRLRAAGKSESPEMAQSLVRELELLGRAVALSPAEVRALAGGAELPGYASTPCEFAGEYTRRLGQIDRKGYGIFATYHMFSLAQDGRLQPVNNPDPQRLCELTGYEREREQVILNTKALLKGLPANNILLYGDAGTGKSSTVKALANEYRAEGLRLVEVRKNQLYQIPELMDALARNPLRFILFIDDLSFPADDGDFTALKAILEGNISARPGNIVVYATSNRRHMMRERFADRMGEDVHRGDTLEEQTSLAARFGLTITFLKPDRDLYADIVRNLAKEYGLVMEDGELLAAAEAHALRYGGRSPRVARQFVELAVARQELGKG